MSTPIRSANKAYYASKEPLLFRGTKEGRKNPPRALSYKQKANDVAASSAKYYANMPTSEAQPAAINQKAASKVTGHTHFLEAGPKVMQEVVRVIQQNAPIVHIKGEAADITKARAAVDMSVGRKVLTREQADRVTFTAVKAPEPKKTKAADKPENTPATETPNDDDLLEYQQRPDGPADKKSGLEEADAILNPPKKVKPESKRRTRKKQEESITEDDIAAAFGVSNEFDDDSDD